jgi:hypothetical protein
LPNYSKQLIPLRIRNTTGMLCSNIRLIWNWTKTVSATVWQD